jgi:formate hydrogenlyase subunit 3/multisubunit Na+/H+ antiporter MnhD subunit
VPAGAVTTLVVAFLAAAVTVLGIAPQPLVAVASEGARGLVDPAAYAASVFPEVPR